jgi:hypothetical protein
MAQTKKAAAGTKAAAATTEQAPVTRTLEHDGLVIEGLPAKLPFRLLRALYDVHQSSRDGENTPAAIIGFIDEVLNADQMTLFWDHFGDRDMDDAEEILSGIVQAIFELYGTSTGESSASPQS